MEWYEQFSTSVPLALVKTVVLSYLVRGYEVIVGHSRLSWVEPFPYEVLLYCFIEADNLAFVFAKCHIEPAAPVVQFVTSKRSDVGTCLRIPVQSHELGFFLHK